MRNKALKTLYIFNGIFVFAAAMLAPIYALFAEGIGASIFIVSTLVSIFLVSTIFFTLIIRKIGDKVKEKEHLLLAGFLVRAVAWFAIVFINTVSGLFIIQIIIGLGEALGSPAFNAIFAEHLDDGRHIEEYSNWQLVATASAAVAAILGGYIVLLFGFKPLFIIMSLLALISFMGILLKPRSLL